MADDYALREWFQHHDHFCYEDVYPPKQLEPYLIEYYNLSKVYRVNCIVAAVDASFLLVGDNLGCVQMHSITPPRSASSSYKFKAHLESVRCLAITPDGNSFVSGSEDETLKLWRFEALQDDPSSGDDTSSGEYRVDDTDTINYLRHEPLIVFEGHSDEVTACVVSSDGSRLYSGSNDSSICIWDMATGETLEILELCNGGVTSLALSGSLLVSGSEDGTVKLWDIGSMQLLHTLQGHSNSVASVYLTSDGSLRVISGSGSDVYVWDAASGAQLEILEGHSSRVVGVTVSSDGSLAASASDDDTICVWDLASLTLFDEFKRGERRPFEFLRILEGECVRAVLFVSGKLCEVPQRPNCRWE
jgi:WD40 repeat protein